MKSIRRDILFADAVPRCGFTYLRRLEHLDASRIKVGPQVCIFDRRQRYRFPVLETCEGSADTILRRHDGGRIEIVDADTRNNPYLRIGGRGKYELHAHFRIRKLVTKTDGEQHHMSLGRAVGGAEGNREEGSTQHRSNRIK